MISHILTIDTETGGLKPESTILEAYFGLFEYSDGVFTQKDELNLFIKPDDDIYRVTAESLEITNINLVKHNEISVYQRKAGTMLYDKLSNWYKISNNKRLTALGHNVAFDINKIKTTLVNPGTWEQFVSHRVLDTSTTSQFLILKGVLPSSMNGSLGELINFFNIQTLGFPHEAKYDALATIKVFEKLINL
jgi:DNA polymerase III epsilon subunit-like protein